jgi:hypothetical protein
MSFLIGVGDTVATPRFTGLACWATAIAGAKPAVDGDAAVVDDVAALVVAGLCL